MESMGAREYVELFFEDRAKANIASLGRVYRNMLVAHASLLIPEFLSILRVLFNLVTQFFNLAFVIVKTLAQVLFHVFYFGILREQVQ